MSVLVNLGTEMSIEGCAGRIDDLQIEIAKVEAKIDALSMAQMNRLHAADLISEVRDEASGQKSR
jgi:hypothetical protein